MSSKVSIPFALWLRGMVMSRRALLPFCYTTPKFWCCASRVGRHLVLSNRSLLSCPVLGRDQNFIDDRKYFLLLLQSSQQHQGCKAFVVLLVLLLQWKKPFSSKLWRRGHLSSATDGRKNLRVNRWFVAFLVPKNQLELIIGHLGLNVANEFSTEAHYAFDSLCWSCK